MKGRMLTHLLTGGLLIGFVLLKATTKIKLIVITIIPHVKFYFKLRVGIKKNQQPLQARLCSQRSYAALTAKKGE